MAKGTTTSDDLEQIYGFVVWDNRDSMGQEKTRKEKKLGNSN